jgi:hypothetical protein
MLPSLGRGSAKRSPNGAPKHHFLDFSYKLNHNSHKYKQIYYEMEICECNLTTKIGAASCSLQIPIDPPHRCSMRSFGSCARMSIRVLDFFFIHDEKISKICSQIVINSGKRTLPIIQMIIGRGGGGICALTLEYHVVHANTSIHHLSYLLLE